MEKSFNHQLQYYNYNCLKQKKDQENLSISISSSETFQNEGGCTSGEKFQIVFSFFLFKILKHAVF